MTKELNVDDIKLDGKDFFYCYDPRLSNFLKKEGVEFITSAIHIKSHKRFFLYYRNESLNISLDKYHSSKNPRYAKIGVNMPL